MTVKVTERDDSHKSHEGVAAGIRIWDVHQQELLVGMFLIAFALGLREIERDEDPLEHEVSFSESFEF